MKMNHLALITTDVAASREFLMKYFGLQELVKGNNDMAILADDDGAVISLFRNDQANYPKGFHFGFGQESKEQVNEINTRLKEDGFMVDTPSRLHGTWTFYMDMPGGPTIEVLHWLGGS